MIREVDLASYMPPFMKKYREPAAAMESENPEFTIAWDGVDSIQRNRFISTADKQGLARYEKLLGIRSAEGESVEGRRLRVRNRWFNAIPYTMRTLADRITECLEGEYNFSLHPDFTEAYGMTLVVYSDDEGKLEELKYLISALAPVNMAVELVYESLTGRVDFYCGGVMEQADILELKQR